MKLKLAVLAAGLSMVGWTYGAEYADTFNSTCPNDNLHWTSDQASGFMSEMGRLGQTRKAMYGNQSFWPDDMREDQMVGSGDYPYADTWDFGFFSSHGGSVVINGDKRYIIATPVFHASVNSCYNATDQMILGENPGDTWANPHEGYLNWMALATCHSIEPDSAVDVWMRTAHGIHMIVGYNGTSCDSPTTSEVGEDLATNFIGSGWSLFQSWDNAGHDWWCDDHPSAIAFGTDANDVVNRLFNETKNSITDVTSATNVAIWFW